MPLCASVPALLRRGQVFLAVFTVEMLCKITALGLVVNQGAYLRDSVRGGVGKKTKNT